MNSSLKIRLLFLLLTVSFIVTALTLRFTFHIETVLMRDANDLETALHEQEAFVNTFTSNPANFRKFRNVHRDSVFALSLLELRKERSIYFYTYYDHKLTFWGANRITPESDAGLKEGTNMLRHENGWYEVIKKTEGNFSLVTYIPVKAEYPIQNAYLINVFTPRLTTSETMEIASFGDDNVYNIRSSLDNRYLFSVKLKQTVSQNAYSTLELLTWIVSILLTCLLVNSLCLWIAARGYVKTALLTLVLFFTGARILALDQNWFILHFDLPVFNPKYYGAGPVYPSIGDLLLNVTACSWSILFAYRFRDRIVLAPANSPVWVRSGLFLLLALFYTVTVIHVDETFRSLVINSSIHFDLNNILNLDSFSWLGIFILCLGALNMYLLLITLLTVIRGLHLFLNYRYLLPAALLLASAACFLLTDMTPYFAIFCVVVLLCAWMILKKGLLFSPVIFALNLALFSSVCSMKLFDYRAEKDLETRRVLAGTLELSDDPSAVLYFDSLEQRIVSDDIVLRYFRGPVRDFGELRNRLQKFYFDGYLNRYELRIHQYDPQGNAIAINESEDLNRYKELVMMGTLKVSRFFYKLNNTFGIRHFFAILPISSDGKTLGTLVVELKSGTFESPDAFPRVLADSKMDETDKIRDYSFAFYKNGELVNQYGNYPYRISDREYVNGKGITYTVKRDHYSHLIYRPNARSLIVVSSSVPGIILRFGSLSFLFLVLLFFSALCAATNWTWKNIILYNPGTTSRWRYITQGGHILYKTRIQVSIVLSVILTLGVVGLVTYFNIRRQYSRQQEQTVSNRLEKIVTAFEEQIPDDDRIPFTEDQFNSFAEVNTADLTLFDREGRLYFTTQPKIYNAALISGRINTKAFIYLNIERLSEYINTNEGAGRLVYIAVYRPIHNKDHKIIGYLSLPFFSNQHELDLRIGEFLNSMVNVYALVLVAIGFFAVFMANQITNPLTIIQKSLSQIKIGTKNNPITWKRNDEIGSLIREYNTMIAELEESTARLARSERETAWKEMAKQVAHEIKNPLTPLKLGVQLLDKSYRENDPNFSKKFERFSKSFIEQIESLAHIASEFSNFAKMPETSLESVVLSDVIGQSIEVYSKLEHVTISFDDRLGKGVEVKGDRDQLMRCFNNLIKNATEAIPATRHGQILITSIRREGHALISLSDNGKGIPDGLKERIFNPNFTTKSSGTGLGLAFVKQAIENMAGTIRFTTAQDTGTTFYITLPLVV